jgi:hypothetical protein
VNSIAYIYHIALIDMSPSPFKKPKLVNTKLTTYPTYAGIAKSGVEKSPPTSPKSPTRSSLRQQKKEPESGPLPGTWEGFSSSTKPSDFAKEKVPSETPEGVPCYKLFKIHKETGHQKLWGYYSERKAEHFYPGQLVRAMDCIPQTWFNAPLNDENTAPHYNGPVYAKRRPMVILWKTQREIVCLPIRSLLNSIDNFGKDPQRWQEFISVTTLDDDKWTGNTPWTGPPLTFAAELKDLHPRCYIQLTKPISIQMQSEMELGLGRLTGSSYCRLVEAYSYSQALHKEKAFEEYGQRSNLPDGSNWWEGKESAEWRVREHQMDPKKPVASKPTKTYELQ